MWDSLRLEEFRVYIDDLIQHPNVQMMNQIKQHINGVSCLDHCIFVSYLSFSICKKLKLNAKAAARAGLLHDLYLCDWSQTNIGPWKRLLIHPPIALRNAEIHGLSDLEKDIISKHMWPLTLRKIPRYRESVVVNLADKICACAEMLRLYSKIGAGTALAKYNLCKQMLPQSAA